MDIYLTPRSENTHVYESIEDVRTVPAEDRTVSSKRRIYFKPMDSMYFLSPCPQEYLCWVVMNILSTAEIDTSDIFVALTPVCRTLGIHCQTSFCNLASEKESLVIPTMLGTKYKTFLSSFFQFSFQDDNYPGCLLYDIGFCISQMWKYFDNGKFQGLLEGHLGFSMLKLETKRRYKIRLLKYLCSICNKQGINHTALKYFEGQLPMARVTTDTRLFKKTFNIFPNHDKANYDRAKIYALKTIDDQCRSIIENIASPRTAQHIFSFDLFKKPVSSSPDYNDFCAIVTWDACTCELRK